MLLTTTLLLAVLGPAAQEPPAPAPSPATEEAAPAAEAPAAAAADTGSADTHIAAGIAAFKRRRFREAQTHFQAAVDADGRSAAAHWYLGYTIYKIAEPKRPFHPEKQKAAEHFSHAYSIDPSFKPSWQG